ncbi:mitochondrial calcium uniporter regulator 1 [Oryzias melastigma]|uniref:Mitochondrial calcium uniporter regulator 1 n=1 Tax=Oryzias melastigma TaxID=30732 RepID=A0A3B3DSI5_ORYME|nr:mitochondrial calcium uniporter regulator 1 [Oryzias melastigma]
MVSKACQTRIKCYVVSYPEKWRDSTVVQDKVGCFSSAGSLLSIHSWRMTVVEQLSDFQRAVFASSSNFVKFPLRGRRARNRNEWFPSRLSVRELSTSIRTLQYDMKPDVPKAQGRKLFFDTRAVVRLFEENGFSTQQAEVMVNVLMRTTNSNMEVVYSDMVTKVQQEIMLQRVMSQIAAVKKDMIILEKSEFSALLAENEKLKVQLLQLNEQLADVMKKVRSDNKLDLNLEKSRVKELKVEHDKRLLETRTEIMEMTADQDGHLTQTNIKIDTEVAGLKTMLESHKLDTIKYLAGSVFTGLTVVLGFYRIWM